MMQKHARITALLMLAFLAGCAATTNVAAPPATPKNAASNIRVPEPLAAQMRRVSAELGRVGLQPAELAFAGFLPGGNHATYALTLEAGTCTTLVALATRNARDMDAALYTPDGDLLAVDSEPDPHPTIQVCSEVAQDVYYVLQLVDGDGSFVVLPFHGARSTLSAAARVVGGRPVVVEAVPSRQHHEDPIASLAEGMRKRGFVQDRRAEQLALADHERLRTALPARAGECYTVAAFGNAGLVEVSLRVTDERGALLAETEGGPREHAAVQMCVRTSGDYVVEIEALTGSGNVTLMTFRADAASAGGDEGLWLGKRASEQTRSSAPSLSAP